MLRGFRVNSMSDCWACRICVLFVGVDGCILRTVVLSASAGSGMSVTECLFGASDSFGLLPPPLARVFLGGPSPLVECTEPAESTVCEACK